MKAAAGERTGGVNYQIIDEGDPTMTNSGLLEVDVPEELRAQLAKLAEDALRAAGKL